MESLGYDVEPKYNDDRCDIVQNIIFRDREKLIKYVQGVQGGGIFNNLIERSISSLLIFFICNLSRLFLPIKRREES